MKPMQQAGKIFIIILWCFYSPSELLCQMRADTVDTVQQEPDASGRTVSVVPSWLSDSLQSINSDARPSIDEPPLSQNDATGIPLVSNVFFETDLRQALRDLSEATSIPIIADNSVQGLVTLNFEEAPLDKVLDKILASGGYTYRKIDDYYLIGAPQPENPSFSLLADVQYYNPKYVTVEQIPALLPSSYQVYLRLDQKSNRLGIIAPPNIMQKINDCIEQLDVPLKQISIEAIVTELSNEAKKSLGLDWGWLGQGDGRQLNAASNLNTIVNDSSLVGTLIRTGVKYKTYNYDMMLALKALATSGKATIKANPKVTTLSGQEANIFIGSERYFSIVTGPVNYPYTRLEKIPAGISLKILPRVSSTNEITVNVECEVSEVTEIGISGLPLVTKRNAKTNICVQDGGIIAIGGLTQQGEITSQKKIPLLGSIPLLGYAFSHTQKEKIDKELNIFIHSVLVNPAQK